MTSYSDGTSNSSNKGNFGGEIPFVRSGEISLAKTELFIN